MSTPNNLKITRDYIYIGDLGGSGIKRKGVSEEGMLNPDQKIGPHTILELIAEGGMARVYKVWNTNLEVVRAIKILKSGFTEETRSRLMTEAKISAHLHHPSIVTIFGVSLWNETTPYIEMEYIEGHSLKQLLECGEPLPLCLAVAVGWHICSALHYAHNQKYTLYGKVYDRLVHRDIKPANVLISRKGTVKLADFGIARPSNTSIHTVGDKVLGTFSYVSPEQLNSRDIDHRSDIYALGCVLYEMVTGRKAFPQKTLPELINRKIQGHYRRIPSPGITVPKKLTTVIDKCMATTASRRYASAEEVQEELTGILERLTDLAPEQIIRQAMVNPESIRDAGPPVRASRPRGWIIAALAAGLLLTAAGLAIGPHLVQFRRNNQPRPNIPSPPPEPSPVTNSIPEKNQAQTAPRSRPRRTRMNTTNSATAIRPDPFIMAKKAYAGGDYARARRILESLTPPLNSRAAGMLLACYLETGMIQKAADFSEKILSGRNAIEDGYLYVLRGRTLCELEQFDLAVDALNLALETPSRIVDQQKALHEAVYWWATAKTGIAQQQPSKENKEETMRAWEKFRTLCETYPSGKYCGDLKIPQ